MADNLDGENLTQEKAKTSVVQEILEDHPEQETSKEEQETSEEETNVESEEETEVEGETEILPDQEVKVTEDIAEQFGLDKSLIGSTVKFTEEEILEAIGEEEEQAKENIGEEPITEELAEVLGLPKTFIGKPLSLAGKSYKEAVKWENENNKQIKNLQRTVEELVSKLSNKELSQIEGEANREAAEVFPDPYTEPEEFSKWLKKRDDLMLEKILEKVNENPSIKAADELAAQQMQQLAIKELQLGLGEGVKAENVLESWYEEHKDDYEALAASGIYKNNPKKLARDILIWHKANSYDSLSKKKESEIRKQVHKKTVENLKAKSNKTKIKYGSSPRGDATKNDSVVSQILQSLEERNALKGS